MMHTMIVFAMNEKSTTILNRKNTLNSSENVHRSILTVFATQFFFISTNLNFFSFLMLCAF